MEENNNITYGEKVASNAAEKVGKVALYALLGVMAFCLLTLPFCKLWSYEFCCFMEKFTGWALPGLFALVMACSSFCAQICEKSINGKKK